MRVAPSITPRDDERKTLEHWLRGQAVPHRLVQRSKIVLLAGGGMENRDIAAALHCK